MTARVIKSVSLPSVSVREPLAPGRGRERRARDESNPRTRPRSAPSSPEAGRKLLVARKKSTQRRARNVSGRRQQNAKRRQAGVTTISSRQRHASVAVIETPGYTLCRTPTNVFMNINTAAFFGDKDVVQSEPSRQVSPPDVSILQSLEESVRMQQLLQREIADVSVRLEREKEDHQQHIEELQEEFEKEKKHIAKAHQVDLSNQQERHERETKILQEKHNEELHALESEMSAEISQLRGELEFTKELMERTKADLISDAEEKLKEREQELSEHQSAELQKLTRSLHAEAESRLSELRVTLEKEMKEKEEEMKLENEVLLSRCSNFAELEDELTQSKKQTKKLQSEISELEEAVQEAHTLQVSTEAQLLETQHNLEAFERDFQDKVRTVEDHHRSRIDTLLQENTALRRRLLLKTEEFSQFRSSVEKSQRMTLNTFKERVKVVVHARSRADLGVAMGLDETSDSLCEDSEGRPLSAPTTRAESGRAKGRASSAAIPAKMGGMVPFRPHSCHTELNRHSSRKH